MRRELWERIERSDRTRAQRRQEWKETTLQIARSHGDERPGDIILREASQKAGICGKAEKESYRDHERAETIAITDYFWRGIALIDRGTVLTASRALRHCDPVLRKF